MNQKIDGPSASGELRVRLESAPFSSIRGQSKLFLDFLSDPESLSRFYPNAVRSHAQVAYHIPSVLEAYKVDRGALCDALSIQHRPIGGSTVFENIELLRGENTVAVVTGQQAGLFTGPLYTIYKALSAVRMAACLRDRGFKAVPVFWAATEDHDFGEVSVATVTGADGQVMDIRHTPAAYSEKEPVGCVVLDTSVTEAIDELFSILPATVFSDSLRKNIEAAYAHGKSFGTAFTALVSKMFERYGLIVVDPLDPALKRLAAPVYRQAVSSSAEIVSAIVDRGKELTAAGYHTQVEVAANYFPLFWHDEEGRRLPLRVSHQRTVQVSGINTTFTLDDLEQIANDTPERLSPGVMMRPVVQDYLFPTVCYFGGAAEIAYFAQNSEVYRILGRPVTPILHRQSFTMVETRFGRSMKKLGLSFDELFTDYDTLRSKIVRDIVDPETARLFAEVEENINAQLHRLDANLSGFDGSLAAGFAKRRRKIVYHIAATRARYERERLSRDAIIDQRLRSLLSNVAPRNQLQERTINVTQFIDRYGEDFIDWIYRCIDLDDNGHRIIYF